MDPDRSQNSLEAHRLLALKAAQLLDSMPEAAFDRLTALASKVLQAPLTLITLVDADRQFFASHNGLAEPWASQRQTPLSHSFCQYVVASGEPLVVNDSRTHPLVAGNLAIRDLNVIAYAGVPMINSSGYCLGSFCAIDVNPRAWKAEEIEILRSLSAQAMTEIELRLRNLERFDDVPARPTPLRATVSDLRTPLFSLLMNLEAIKGLPGLPEDAAAWIELSTRSAEALKLLADDLTAQEALSIGGPSALSLRPAHPAALSLAAYDQVRGLAAKKGVRLEQSIESHLPMLMLDEPKMVRVLVNLLGNAIKFTAAGGQVTLAVHFDRPEQVITFAVHDTGIGLRSEELVRLLSSAKSTESPAAGGLKFCHKVVEAHGGKLSASSIPGTGSAFSMQLPASG